MAAFRLFILIAFIALFASALGLKISARRASVLVGSSETVQVTVTDPAGAALSGCTVSLVSAAPADDDEHTIAKNVELTSGSAGVYEYNLLSAASEIGFYQLELSAKCPGQSTESASVTAKIVSGAAPKRAAIVVQSTDGDAVTEEKIAAGKSAGRVKFGAGQKLIVKFRVADGADKLFRPQQAFVRLRNKDSNQEQVFVATAQGKAAEHNLAVTIPATEVPSGAYEVSILVGDAQLQSPTQWVIAELAVSNDAVSVPVRLWESLYAARNEIVHQFRRPEKRPSAFMATVFSAGVLAPILLLLGGLLAIGANLRNLPLGAKFLPAVAFIALLGAIMALYVLYWLQLTLFPTLGLLTALGTAAIFAGQRALSDRALA
eukprot:TRINITY_DN14988_c0_g1_i1.p1 TRINITY_DN14988_c0_g1~~TRINITY_DN14988_c0_g1_i1.p1  ORF type:complete len:376 (-),score=123.97 TRINITY_DN14988_c0_g1_i1:45-1172(-)